MYEKLFKYLEDNKFPTGRNIRSKEHKEFYDEVKRVTSFLDEVFPDVPHNVRLGCIVKGIHEVPMCRVCNEKYVKFTKIVKDGDIYPMFTDTCSKKCSAKDPFRIAASATAQREMSKEDKERKVEKTRNTVRTKTNGECDWASKTKESKEKAKRTWSIKTQLEIAEKTKKAKSTYFRRTGYENPSQNPEVAKKRGDIYGDSNFGHTDSAKTKRASTNLAQYGSEIYFESEDCKVKTNKTNNKNHGVDWNTQREDVKDKSMKSKKLKTGREYNHQSHISEDSIEILKSCDLLGSMLKDENFSITRVAEILGVHRKTVSRNIAKHGIEIIGAANVSSFELEVRSMISEIYQGEVIFNTPLLGKKHIDIYIPEKKIGIECNGSYFHSSAKKDKNYHFEKTEESIKKGIRLFHVWEHVWKTRKAVLKKMFKHVLGRSDGKIYARTCATDIIHPKEAREFLDNNHIQGFAPATQHIGIIHEGELVGVLSMLQTRKESSDYDLVRFCTSRTVVGGFSKALTHFKRLVPDWGTITTFADRDISYGELYETCGFNRVHVTPPIMSYYDPNTGEHFHRQKFMKSRLNGKVDVFDDSLTEKEIMEVNGYLRIYNSGLIKYRMTNNT